MDIKFTTGHVLTVGAVMTFMQSDWLLIYKINDDENKIIFERTGSHSDLF